MDETLLNSDDGGIVGESLDTTRNEENGPLGEGKEDADAAKSDTELQGGEVIPDSDGKNIILIENIGVHDQTTSPIPNLKEEDNFLPELETSNRQYDDTKEETEGIVYYKDKIFDW